MVSTEDHFDITVDRTRSSSDESESLSAWPPGFSSYAYVEWTTVLLVRSQKSQTVGHPYSDTSPYGKCYLQDATAIAPAPPTPPRRRRHVQTQRTKSLLATTLLLTQLSNWLERMLQKQQAALSSINHHPRLTKKLEFAQTEIERGYHFSECLRAVKTKRMKSPCNPRMA